jgi:hypothetical protein
MTADPGRPALSGPAADLDLTRFPAVELPAGRHVFRAHSRHVGPWWFSQSDQGRSGRFDLASPRGTLYVADGVETAVRERVRGRAPGNRAGLALVDDLVVSEWATARAYRCANLDTSLAARFGVTRELTALHERHYGLTQAWAEAFAAAGFEGLRYGARFTPGRANAWALFGQAGDAERPEPAIEAVIAGPDACRQAGLSVAGAPVLGHLNIIP